jgi:hypothetical protein
MAFEHDRFTIYTYGQAVSAFAIHGRHLLPENMNCFHCHRPLLYNQTDCLHKIQVINFKTVKMKKINTSTYLLLFWFQFL